MNEEAKRTGIKMSRNAACRGLRSAKLVAVVTLCLTVTASATRAQQVHTADDAMMRDLGIYDAQLNIPGAGVLFCDPKQASSDNYPNYGTASFGKILRTIFPRRQDGSYVVTSVSTTKFRISGALHLLDNIAHIAVDEALKGDPSKGLRHPMFALREGTTELMLFTHAAKALGPKFYRELNAVLCQEEAFMNTWEDAPQAAGDKEKTAYTNRVAKIQALLASLMSVWDL